MKKVLILANSSAGLYLFRNELLLELLKEYEVYASLPDDVNNEEMSAEGCIIVNTNINRRGVNPLEDIKLLQEYIALLERIKPDVVLSYTIKPNVYGGIACRIKKIPYLANVTGLGSALENPGLLQNVTKLMYKTGLKKADTVFFQNSVNMEFFKNNRLVNANTVLLPGSGVNVDRFCKQLWPEDKIRFVYISRVMKEKGIEEFLYCAQTIKKEYPDVEFHILGPCEEDYTDTLNKRSKDNTIKYHGKVKNVIPYLKDMSCIIHPSYHEGMSNVCLEAAASARAVITTDCPGCRETVVDGKTGYIVPVKDKEQLTEAVRRFIKLPTESQKQMGIAGREHVKNNFDRNIVVKAYLENIKRLVE